MKLTAIDAESGRVLMTQSGSMREDDFKATVLGSFPEQRPDKLVIVVDGRIKGMAGGAPLGPREARRGKSVVWKGSYSDAGGYALMNREIVTRLPHHGFQVKVEMLKTAPQVGATTMAMLRAMESARIPDERSCPLVIGFTPMPVQPRGRRVIFYTMMESQGVHPSFVDRCNRSATEIWVPCRFYERAFREGGIKRPIHVLPLGANHLTYTPDAPDPQLMYEEMPSGKVVPELPDGFRFMSVFGWSYRKGPDALCRSFLQEFGPRDDACLVIYSRYMGSSAEQHKDHVRNEIREYYAQCDKERPPRIFYCGDVVHAHDLPGCYAAADAFVFCSRGEGFALPVIESGACGTPVISSYNTAMTDYLDDEVAYCVPPDGYAPANEKLCWISGYYRDQEFAVLGEQAVAGFRRAMRDAYSKQKEAEAKAQKFRDRILEKYTWDRCAERVAERLNNGK